jgi:hypothetical protein
MLCPICGKEVKRLKYHIWRSHTAAGQAHRPGPKKGNIPWNKGKQVGWNRGLTKETSKSVAQQAAKTKGRKFGGVTEHTEEIKAEIASAMRGNQNANHRGKKTVYKGIKMDSSWEAGVAKYFDDTGVQWKYASQIFILDERRSYRPDFILTDGTVIEVKGYWRKENKAKFDEWRSKYPNIKVEVWDKIVLREKKIINKEGYVINGNAVELESGGGL